MMATYPKDWFIYLIHNRELGKPVLMVHQEFARRPYVDPRFVGSLARTTSYPWWALGFATEREAGEFLAFFLPPALREPNYTYVISNLSAREAAQRQRMRDVERGKTA